MRKLMMHIRAGATKNHAGVTRRCACWMMILAGLTGGRLAAEDAIDAAKAAFANLAKSGKFIELCPEYAGMESGGCVEATKVGDGAFCPTTRVQKGGDVRSCSMNIFQEVKAGLSTDLRAKLEASSLNSAELYSKITPRESAVHFHSSTAAATAACGPSYVARIDSVDYRFALFNSKEVTLSINIPNYPQFEAQVKETEGQTFTFNSLMCGRVKHAGACGPARASNVVPPTPTEDGRTVSRPPAPEAPTERSLKAWAGQPRVFVAGEVSSQDEVVVTVRGTNSFQGMVVSAEANGRKTEAPVDSKGHAVLPMAALAAGGAAATLAVVHVIDSGRQDVAQAQTRITPGAGAAAAPPQVPALPRLIPNGDVVTIPGQNLGSQSQLVVGNRIQETLTASSKELTSFIDAPAAGAQTAYVQTPYGVSPSQTVHAYNFTVKLPQSTISRGQQVTAVAHYEGLPPGSEIEFTNASPTVVDMEVQGASRAPGKQNVFTVSQASGDCQVTLTGKRTGGFVVDYQVRPPQ